MKVFGDRERLLYFIFKRFGLNKDLIKFLLSLCRFDYLEELRNDRKHNCLMYLINHSVKSHYRVYRIFCNYFYQETSWMFKLNSVVGITCYRRRNLNFNLCTDLNRTLPVHIRWYKDESGKLHTIHGTTGADRLYNFKI